MKKQFHVIGIGTIATEILLLFILSYPSHVMGAGYQIPNQSIRAVGIAGATIAHTPGPDAAYYNPANMTYLEDKWSFETSLTTLWLPEVNYSDQNSKLRDGTSDKELFFLPQIHIASRNFEGLRFGFSLAYPYGLAKSWDQPFPAVLANKFALTVVEASPSFSYKISPQFSVAAGIRIIKSNGEVENRAIVPILFSNSVEADDTALGYTLAASYSPTDSFRIATTFKSEVNLTMKGTSDLKATVGTITYNESPDTSLKLTLPAVFSLATAFDPTEKLTIEITWNRTFWSAMKNIDFNYSNFSGNPYLALLDPPLTKNWTDSDAFRLGLTYTHSENVTFTSGIAFDETPVPERTLGFELPDSDAFMYSFGIQFQVTDSIIAGISYMYHHTTSRTVSNTNNIYDIGGKFTDGGAHAINCGLIYHF